MTVEQLCVAPVLQYATPVQDRLHLVLGVKRKGGTYVVH